MLTIIALIATCVIAPIETAGNGTDYAYVTYFRGEVTVITGKATIRIYDVETGFLLDEEEWNNPGTYDFSFDLGHFDGGSDEFTWRATCVYNTGTPPHAIIAHRFEFPDDFTFVPKYWFHEFNF